MYPLSVVQRCYFSIDIISVLESGESKTTTEHVILQLDTMSSVKALHARLHLPQSFSLSLLAQTLVHPSSDIYPNNKYLARSGTVIAGYVVTEFLLAKYPRLPYPILTAALQAFAGVPVLYQVGREWGVELGGAAGSLQFKRSPPGAQSPKRGEAFADRAMTDMVRSVIAGVYTTQDFAAAKTFIHNHLLSRSLNLSSLFNFMEPTRELARLCARENLQHPVFKPITETGRLSQAPVFVIGVYTGNEIIGQGQASSIREAKFRAAVNALKAWYLYENKPFSLPSSTLDSPPSPFIPNYIDTSQVIV